MEVDPPPAAPAPAEPGSPPAVNPAPVAPRRIGHWQVDKQIGRGSFAVVWRARHAETGQRVAVKEIRLDKLNRKLRESLESEIQVLQRSRHGNIIRLHDIIKEEKRIFLVLEYCAGGDVSEFIKKHGRVREDVARHFMRQMASGLRAMRAQNLIHRDLKPQNLLLTVASPDAELKIADFGFARYMHPTGMAETLCGSPLYMAPEILGYQKYDAKADLWSVGTILYELLVGRPPFTGMNPMQLLRNIERSDAKIPSKVANGLSRECVSILRGLLRRNPVERMSFDEFFDHPFLTGQATIVRGGPPSETRREAGASGGGDAAGADSGMSGGDDTSGSGDSSQMPFPMEDDSTSTGTHATTTNTTTTNRTNTTQRQQASVGGNPRPPPPAPTPTHLQHRHAHPPHVHHASIPSSVEKAARGVGNVAAAAAMGVRDVAAAAAAAGTNWLSTSPLSRRRGFLGGTSPGGGRPLGGSGSHQKPPLSSSPSVARAASFGGFTPGGDGVSVEIQPVPFSLQGSKARSGSDRSLNSMDAEYVLVEDDKSGGDKSGGLASMESSPGGSLPSGGGGGGGGLTQMAAGLTRRLSSNLGAVILGSSPPPSKFGNHHHHVTSSSSSPGRELYRMSSSPGGTGLGSGGSPGSFPPRPGSSRHSPPGMLGELGARNSPSYPSSRVSSARSGGGGGSGLALGAGASLAPSQSPSEKEAAAALALARVAQAAAAAAPGEKRFASAAQRVSVLERAATVLRDVAMERWDSGKRLDALSVSLVSLTALREGYKLAQAVAKEAAEAEACSNAPQGLGPLDGSRNVRLSDMSDSSRSSGGGGGDCASRPASASSSSSGSPPWIPGRSSSSSQSGTIGSSAELPPRLSSKTPDRLRKDRERAVKTAERIKNAFNAALTRADRAAAAVKGVGVEGSAVLPDAMDLAYDAALALGRSGAVEELMGNTRTALEAYSRAQTLLVFILSEGPRFVTARDEQSGDERAATDAERETAAALVSAPGRCAGDGVETGAGSRLVPSVHPCDEFPARGRIARFVGAIGARQQACAATAMRSSSGATRRPP